MATTSSMARGAPRLMAGDDTDREGTVAAVVEAGAASARFPLPSSELLLFVSCPADEVSSCCRRSACVSRKYSSE